MFNYQRKSNYSDDSGKKNYIGNILTKQEPFKSKYLKKSG